jgi:ankyrin repeat protein
MAKSKQNFNKAARDENGNTPLITAANDGDFNRVKELLAKKAPLNDVNNYGMNALAVAVLFGDKKIAGLLLQKGATLTATQVLNVVEAAYEESNRVRPLQESMMGGTFFAPMKEVVEALKLVAEVQERTVAKKKDIANSKITIIVGKK